MRIDITIDFPDDITDGIREKISGVRSTVMHVVEMLCADTELRKDFDDIDLSREYSNGMWYAATITFKDAEAVATAPNAAQKFKP